MKTTWTEFDGAALRRNLRRARRALAPDKSLYFVVKAKAYGHGLAAAVKAAAQAGIDRFAVANVDEGLAVRSLQNRAEILVLCAPPPDCVPELISHNLIALIAGPEHAKTLAAAVRRRHPRSLLTCHAKIDTGMARLGFDWTRAPEELANLARNPHLSLRGIASHFAAADEHPGYSAGLQFRRFATVVTACRQYGLTFDQRHISASAGFNENADWDLDGVRLGILMYGYPPNPQRHRITATPPLQWKTRIRLIKTLPAGRTVGYGHTRTTRRRLRVAVLASGYADGYSRQLSNRGVVLIDGRRCPVIGRVSMNLTTVALPPDCRAQAGDVAVLIGRQGQASVWADELAALSGTIPNEILTSIRC